MNSKSVELNTLQTQSWAHKYGDESPRLLWTWIKACEGEEQKHGAPEKSALTEVKIDNMPRWGLGIRLEPCAYKQTMLPHKIWHSKCN